ncbi:NAD(P)H-hydrate dehydratase [Enterococcus villorum]|uniref:ADP-dependent (S)-NAD(P)H-hydrate dehydratase n=1 Tax=Enterococcus villorum TaxID=112904 RepID=A0A1V8YCP1_9ENTE|nr:NAD(P)H-hydrate dehydratase [Enterococcus villorum]OQO70383.1 NAD(P)H-hydrate dehydratase [Enterococcus villorum]OQO77163.1 NAD(P)H-hydrate dehydratase [Enterococcus villorum]
MRLDKCLLQKVITPRPPQSHKGTFGRTVLIGGNDQYGGAIIMSALATVNSGAGLTTVITDPHNHAPLHAHLPEAMCVNWQDKEQMLAIMEKADVLLIGPGLGTSSKSLDHLSFVLEKQKSHQWLVMDGSALTLFSENQLTLPFPKQTIMTPHQMEWQRISCLTIEEQTLENNQKKQREIGATVVLKSHQTTIYGQNDHYQNTAGSAAMATGGTGDTLAGMITGFLAQFPKNDETVAAAVYLHSFIGDQLAQKQYVVLPTQISQEIPQWMHYFSQTNQSSRSF